MAKKAKVTKAEADTSTEEKIREAARTVFMKKGYAATRTRDIAEEAGINLALLNYYFRSKEKLFELVMQEKLEKFFSAIFPVINDAATSIEAKVKLFVNNYIDLLIEHPNLPIFVLSEIRNNPERFASRMQVKKILVESQFAKQLHEKRPDIDPMQLIISLLGLTIIPFVARPILFSSNSIDEKGFGVFMNDRRVWIIKWFKALLKTK